MVEKQGGNQRNGGRKRRRKGVFVFTDRPAEGKGRKGRKRGKKSGEQPEWVGGEQHGKRRLIFEPKKAWNTKSPKDRKGLSYRALIKKKDWKREVICR